MNYRGYFSLLSLSLITISSLCSQKPNPDVLIRQSGGKVHHGASGTVEMNPKQPVQIPNNGIYFLDEEGLPEAPKNRKSSGVGVDTGGAIRFAGDVANILFGNTAQDRRRAAEEMALKKQLDDLAYGTGGQIIAGLTQGRGVIQAIEVPAPIGMSTPSLGMPNILPSMPSTLSPYDSKNAAIEFMLKKHNPSQQAELDKGVEQLRQFLADTQAPSVPKVPDSSWGQYSYDVWNGSKDMLQEHPYVAIGVGVALAGGALYFGCKNLFGGGAKAAAPAIAAREIHNQIDNHPAAVNPELQRQKAKKKQSHDRHSSPTPDPRTTGVEFKFPEKVAQVDHGWGARGGHIEKGTPKARQMIMDTIQTGTYHGQDACGNHQYSKIMPDGNQLYAHVRDNGLIKNQGGMPPSDHWIVSPVSGLLIPPTPTWNRNLVKPLQYGFAGILSWMAADSCAGIDNEPSSGVYYQKVEQPDLTLPTAPQDHVVGDALPDMPDNPLPIAPRSHTVKNIRKERKERLNHVVRTQAEINKILNRKKY